MNNTKKTLLNNIFGPNSLRALVGWIKTQLDTKINKTDIVTNATTDSDDKVASASVAKTLKDAIDSLVTALSWKQDSVTGAASTITGSNLTASRALVSNANGKVAASAVTSTELGYMSGVTSKVQDQLDGKQASISGGASTITGSNLTASRALVSNANGKVAVSDVTSTELGYLDGVTSAIQTQLENKAPKSHAASGTTYGQGNASNYGHAKLSDTYASSVSGANAAGGVAASQNALYNAYNALNTNKFAASNVASTWGSGTLNSTYVSSGGAFDYVRQKCGSYAITTVNFDFTWSGTYSSSNVAKACSGLPKAKNGGAVFPVASGTCTASGNNCSIRIGTDGVLMPWYCGNVSGHWFGAITYLSE